MNGPLDSDHMSAQNPNLIVYQVNADLPFEIDIEFENNDQEAPPPFGELYTAALSQKQAYFNKKFEETFGLEEKYGDQSQKIKFAQAAMSNMIGGIGYFYGHSLVQSVFQTSPVKYWDGPLFTGVPSRSFFPRGFLWDEGFHNLLISKWNKRLSADIIAHWLDMMNIEGWIPREQILGKTVEGLGTIY
jgi:mannosyl-oligosaccharide glucosidase